MHQYKHLTPEVIEATCRDVDQMLEEQQRKDLEEVRLARIRDYMANPANAAAIAQDPLIRAIRALPSRGGATTQPAPTAYPQPQRTANPAPKRPPTRQELERQKPWLAPRKPEL